MSDKLRFCVSETVFILLFALSVLTGCNGGEGSDAPRSLSSSEALMWCQTAFKSIAKDADSADIPYVPNMGSGNEFYFAWGASTKSIRMRNGLGLDVAASGSCIVDISAKRITSLTLNGQTIR